MNGLHSHFTGRQCRLKNALRLSQREADGILQMAVAAAGRVFEQGSTADCGRFNMMRSMGTAAGKSICTILTRYRKDLRRLIE